MVFIMRIINLRDLLMRHQHLRQFFGIIAMGIDPQLQSLQRFQHHPSIKRREAGAGLAHKNRQPVLDIILTAQNNAAKAPALPVNMFGRGINRDVRAQGQRLLQNRRRKHIIDNQLRAMIMGNIGHRLNVDDFQQRIGRGFQKQDFGFRSQRGLPRLKVAPIYQSAGDAKARHECFHHIAARAE